MKTISILLILLFFCLTPIFAQPVSPEKLVGPVVFHWFGPASGWGNRGQIKTAWPMADGRGAWDGSIRFWEEQTHDIIDSGANFIFFQVANQDYWSLAQRNHLRAIQNLQSGGMKTPLIAPYFGAASWTGGFDNAHPFDLTSPAGKDKFYSQIRRWFTMYFNIMGDEEGRKNLAYVNGEVLIGMWTVVGCPDSSADILDYLEARIKKDFGLNVFWSVHACWAKSAPDEINFLFAGTYPMRLGRDSNWNFGMNAALLPGFWRLGPLAEGQKASFLARNGGETWRQAWEAVLADPRIKRVYWAWNEISENSGTYKADPIKHFIGDDHSKIIDWDICWVEACHPVQHEDFWGEAPDVYIKISSEYIGRFLSTP